MRATENEKRDWAIIALLLLFGLVFILLAGGWALRFTPSWELDANVESMLDPNSDFLTLRPGGFIEPVDPAILTNPAWVDVFLTPGASFSTVAQLSTPMGTSFATPITSTVVTTQMATPTAIAFATNTALVLPSPTNTFVFFPPPPSSTPKTNPISTSTPTPTSTSTATATSTSTATPTSTPTSTPTNTPDPSEPDFGGPDGNATVLGNGMWVEFNPGVFLLDGNSTWDVVYYEEEEASSAGKIHLGAALIEVYDQTTAAWYVVYNWGDGVADTNASYNSGVEPDGYPVDMNAVPLYGAPPVNTGIAIDIDSVAIGQGGTIGDLITKIRITSLSSVKCDIDALQMLR